MYITRTAWHEAIHIWVVVVDDVTGNLYDLYDGTGTSSIPVSDKSCRRIRL